MFHNNWFNNEWYKSTWKQKWRIEISCKSPWKFCQAKYIFENYEELKAFDFYTKLPEVLFFNNLSSFILSNWKPITKTALEPAEQLLLVLMKLRLGIFNEDIAHRFDIGSGTASQIFREWLSRMADVLSVYIRQPSRETMKNTLPRCFLEGNLEDVTCL